MTQVGKEQMSGYLLMTCCKGGGSEKQPTLSQLQDPMDEQTVIYAREQAWVHPVV